MEEPGGLNLPALAQFIDFALLPDNKCDPGKLLRFVEALVRTSQQSEKQPRETMASNNTFGQARTWK